MVKIIHQKKAGIGAQNKYWVPVIEYTIDGHTITKVSSYGNAKPKYEVGQEIEIKYNPNNNDEYYIKGDATAKSLGTIFTILGIVIDIIAIGLTKIL